MRISRLVSAICALSLLLSCRPAKYPIAEYHFCLSSVDEIGELKSVLRQISLNQHMTYYDRSAETQSELRAVQDNSEFERTFPATNVSVYSGDRLGVSVGNLSLPPTHMVMGITEGSQASNTAEFKRYVVARLAQKWHLVRVSTANKGHAMVHCKGDE